MATNLKMLGSYPLILPSANLMEWQGYVKISGNDFKIKIHCPEFPFARNVSVEFDDKLICHVPNYETIVNKIKSNRSLKLNKFLDTLVSQLKELIPQSSIDFHSNNLVLQDLETIRDHIVDISDALDLVCLVHVDGAGRSHTLSVHLKPGARKCFDLDLPEDIVQLFSEANKLKSISGIYKSFCARVDDLQALFFMCDLLDEQTTVLDPAKPERKHVHRKVGLSESVSLEIKLNPHDVYSCPDLEVIGEGTSVASVKGTLELNMKEMGWDEDLNVIENLIRLLDIEEFPDLHSRLASTQAELGEGECSICLSMRHAVTMETPVKLCSNEKCGSFYHEVCLSKWLQSIPASDIGFGLVTGKCPLCKTSISCRLLDDEDED